MKSGNLWTVTIVMTLAVLAAILWPQVKSAMYEASYDVNKPDKVRKIADLRAEDINEITIDAEYKPNSRAFVTLHPKTDREDIEHVLEAVRGIRFTENRSLWGNKWRDRIYIDGRIDAKMPNIPGPPGRKVTFKAVLLVRLDPTKVPVISPTMRSPDLGRIVEDILSRKGEKRPVKRPK